MSGLALVLDIPEIEVVCVFQRVCVHARPRACVYVCALVCVCARARARACVCVYAHLRTELCASVRVRGCVHMYVLVFFVFAFLAPVGRVT